MRYPNPDHIVRPTMDPPRFPSQLTTRCVDSKLYPIHDHEAHVDRRGDGVTDVVASHYHRVCEGRVMPDASDGHTHRLTGLPTGAGAAEGWRR